MNEAQEAQHYKGQANVPHASIINASTTQLRDVHSKFVDLTRKQLGELYSKRDEIHATIEDKERALMVSEQLLDKLSPKDAAAINNPNTGKY